MMERATLHPVPSRPPSPTSPAEAIGYVKRELPGLDEEAAAAFALVALLGRSRSELEGPSGPAAATGLSGEALARALARARKALRRKLHPLPGSGWCERAERLISDRLDGALKDPGPARLEVHLANCGRCVEHERRLDEAGEALTAGFGGAEEVVEPESERPLPEAPPLPPVLRAVETLALPPPSSATDELAPPAPAPDALPVPAREEASQLDRSPPAVPSPRRRPSSPLWTPAAPSPPRTLPVPASAPALAAPTVPSIPPPAPPADPPPAAPSASAPAPSAPAPTAAPAAPPPAPWTSAPVASWTPPTTMPGAEPWRGAPGRSPLTARATLDDTWTSVVPLLAVLAVAVAVFILAALLTLGG